MHPFDAQQSWGGPCSGRSPWYTENRASYSDDEPIEGFVGHLEEEDDPEEDQETDEVVEEQ